MRNRGWEQGVRELQEESRSFAGLQCVKGVEARECCNDGVGCTTWEAKDMAPKAARATVEL